jgi:hypothetical protein
MPVRFDLACPIGELQFRWRNGCESGYREGREQFVRRLFEGLLATYMAIFAGAFVFMLVRTTFVSAIAVSFLGLPWSGWLGLYLHRKGADPESHGEGFFLCCLLGAGLINAAILFGISRLFKKPN